MIGVNDGTAGNPINATFNLSGTGNLSTTSLQVVRGDSTSSFQNSTYNQTAGTAAIGTLLIGGNGANGANSAATFGVTGGTFSATTFSNLSRGNNVSSTMTIGGTAEVTLPAFPTVRGNGSTATLHFDGGTLKPSADSTAYLGGLTNAFIQDGGARFDTNNFNITVSQNLLTHAISTGGGLTKQGAGALTLTGTNTYTGNTTVTGGTLLINGSISTSVLTTVQTGAVLGGTGNVGALTIDAGGTHAPGNSPGIQPVGNYDQNGTLSLEINGLTAGSQHDRVDVTGTVDITGSTLSLSSTGYTAANNDLIFILLNNDSDAITGTFTGLANGSSVGMIGGMEFQISYFADFAGNSFTGGNDIALMAIPEPSAAALAALGTLILLRRRRED
jgi:autotransporter-associated beta strand protein